MRIQYLKLENITSLKGVHSIDFAGMGRQSDLFAITGPTGSGKSSILMAIAMALYGQNHKGLTAADLVTTGCPYGKIELCFVLHAKNYIVTWSCQTLKKDGTPRKTPLAQRHWSVDGKELAGDAQNIIGLSWDQFTKVIILNQGKFSEFLTSTFNKRKEILEKLMGHGQLEILGKHLRRKLNELESKISALQGQTDFAKIMNEEDFEHLKEQQKDIKKTSKYLQTIANECQKIDKSMSEDIKLKEKKIEIQELFKKKSQQQEVLQKELSTIQNELTQNEKKLQVSQKNYKKRKPLLKEATENNNQITHKLIKKDQIEKSKRSTQTQLKIKKDQLELARAKKEEWIKTKNKIEQETKLENGNKLDIIKESFHDFNQKLNWTQRKLDAAINAKSERDSIEDEGKFAKSLLLNQMNSEYLVIIKDSDEVSLYKSYLECEDYVNLASALTEFENKLTIREATLKQKDELSKGISIEEDILGDQYKKNIDQQEIIQNKKQKLLQEIKSLNKKTIKLEDNLLKVTNENKRWELLKLSYDTMKGHGEHLTTSPCPVCSSQPVNWDQVFAPLFDHREETLQLQIDLEKEKEDHHHTLESQKIQEIEFTRREKELSEEAQQISLKIQSCRDKILALQIDEQVDKELSNLTKLIESTRQQHYELKHFLKNRESLIRKWSENENIYKAITKELVVSWEEIQKLTKIFANFSPAFSCPSLPLEDNYVKSREILDQFRSKSDELGLEIDDEITKQNQLQVLKEKIISVCENIDTIHKDITNHVAQECDLSQQEQELATILATLQNKATINKYPKDPESELERLEDLQESARSCRDRSAKDKMDIETRYRQGSVQINNLKERQQELEKLHIQYNDKMSKDLHTLILLYESKPIIQNNLFNFNISEETWFKHLKKYIQVPWDKDFNVQEFQLDQQFHIESIHPEAQLVQEHSISAKEKNAAIEQEIKTYNDQQARIAKLTIEISKKKKQWDQFEVLNHYIGKDRFRDFALTILENTLLDMANHEIKSLAEGRYELLHAQAGKRSEFMVKDQWHGGIERKVSTLSGGETFLLSLGLAMGLSDITRGQTEIESFFIDEGFGTLDDESMSQVLDCLMAIQSRGKQIGIISHVTSLTSQIPVRLEVTKNNFGESSLTIN